MSRLYNKAMAKPLSWLEVEIIDPNLSWQTTVDLNIKSLIFYGYPSKYLEYLG
jgi:hypothetical protein